MCKFYLYCVVFLSIITLVLCSRPRNEIEDFVSDALPRSVASEQVMLDKRNISQSYIDNVEYSRLFTDFSNNSDTAKYLNKKHPHSQCNCGRPYMAYASRWRLDFVQEVNSPLPTNSQLTVTVEDIYYSTDSLFCVALICLYSHYAKIEGLEDMCDAGREYSAEALIGYRDSISQQFKIYPFRPFRTIGFESCQSAMAHLRYMFFNDLKGSYMGLLYYDASDENNVDDYEFNLKDPQFFSSRIFKKDDLQKGCYNFQLYESRGKIFEYQCFSNQPDSIKELWLKGVCD